MARVPDALLPAPPTGTAAGSPDALIPTRADTAPLPLSAEARLFLPGDGQAQPTRAVASSVTTQWGVRWNATEVARDILQNFYDANRARLDEVTITAVRPAGQTTGPATVVIDAPTPFDLERLFFLGSEKGSDDIGAYGEGFKAAALCLLRDFGVTPVAASGPDVVEIRIAAERAGRTNLRPLVYHYHHAATPVVGARLVLPNCPTDLVRELEAGMTHFFWPGNPLLGALVWESDNGQALLYRARGTEGAVFYRRLKRGTLADVPFVLVLDRQYAKIEKAVAKDRDRNAFGERVLDAFFEHFFRDPLPIEVRLALVAAMQAQWERGHPILREVARDGQSGWVLDERNAEHLPGWAREEARQLATLFGDRYYAASYGQTPQERARFEAIEAPWIAAGRTKLPSYFWRFGVPSARLAEQAQARAAAQEEQRKARRLTPAELAAITVLGNGLARLAPAVATLLDGRRARFTVGETETVLGMLRQGRRHDQVEVYLAASLFEGTFADALSVYLHECSHLFGGDGSRGFTDALTRLIAELARRPHDLADLTQQWEAARAQVHAERAHRDGVSDALLAQLVGDLDLAGARALLARVPLAALLAAVGDADGATPLLARAREATGTGVDATADPAAAVDARLETPAVRAIMDRAWAAGRDVGLAEGRREVAARIGAPDDFTRLLASIGSSAAPQRHGTGDGMDGTLDGTLDDGMDDDGPDAFMPAEARLGDTLVLLADPNHPEVRGAAFSTFTDETVLPIGILAPGFVSAEAALVALTHFTGHGALVGLVESRDADLVDARAVGADVAADTFARKPRLLAQGVIPLRQLVHYVRCEAGAEEGARLLARTLRAAGVKGATVAAVRARMDVVSSDPEAPDCPRVLDA